MMRITVLNRQRAVQVKVGALKEFAACALTQCLQLRAPQPSTLARLVAVQVILVSDRRMAQLHRRFLSALGPTDVITFQHGEIFISTETAGRQARVFATSLEHELRLYIAHGLLHLHGFDDKMSADAAVMKRAQEKLVRLATGNCPSG